MHGKSHRSFKLSFQCDQDWNEMEAVEGGRSCKVCETCVIDLSESSKAEILAHPGEQLCGQFRIEQLEPDLIPLKFPSTIRRMTSTAGALLGLNMIAVQGQDIPTPVQTEQVEQSTELKSRKDMHPVQKTVPVEEPETRRQHKHTRRGVYVSKRFPFIQYRRKRILGRLIRYN